MLQIDLLESAAWRFSLDVKDAEGNVVDMDGADCLFIMSDTNEVEVGRASTASGGIVAGPGPEDDNAFYRLTVTVPWDDHSTLDVADEFKNINGFLFVKEDGEWLWNGTQQFRVFASPSITGATGV